eukprot:TRINITY_DN19237_c0_g1_i2.p1 TRINITY_DN19237_c0_g1~~TRINITY_DN19237_c0_g1_i2.p1  ORF type:complete len:431 (-),score=116.30 TRINITY_DN19237_c0_g1_i2:130-1422(-)
MAETESVPMDESAGIPTEELPPSPVFTIPVLQLVKTAQSQHGARYSDYQRYRRYCFSRLRRLYKSLKFLHGRGKYVKRSIDAAIVTDVRFLHIPLYSAERAWGYAMELKAVTSGPDLAQKRTHLIRRMTKAVKWAELFASLCLAKADTKTALEAEAYASYMWGNLLMEKETDWDMALSKFQRVSALYNELGKVGEVSHQVQCRQRVEEMEPSIRYCKYKMGQADIREGGAVLQEITGGEANPAFDLLQSKLEAVMKEARSAQAVDLTELAWMGRKIPLYSTKTRLHILKAQEQEGTLASVPRGERQLGIYDKIFVAYQDAKRQIRDDVVTAGGAEDVKEELVGLEKAVASLLLQRTMERNLLLLAQARARLERQQQQPQLAQQQGPGAGSKEDKGEKPAKPEDLVRLYDTLIQVGGDTTRTACQQQETGR